MTAVEDLEEAHAIARCRSQIDNCLDLVRTRRELAETRRRLVDASRHNRMDLVLVLALVALSYLLGLHGA